MRIAGLLVLAAIGILTLGGEAGAVATQESIVAVSNVYVANMSVDPAAFFTGDSGTVTVVVANGNTGQSMSVNHASMDCNDIHLISSTYDSSAVIGPLQSKTYTFSVVPDGGEGNYFPVFSLDLSDGDTLYYRGIVRVDNTPLIVSVLDRPDAFTPAKKESVTLQIANPRKNDVKNVVADLAGGTGADIVPSSLYVGNLGAGTSTPVNFSITPDHETVLNVTVSYDNGDNHHRVDLAIPVTFSPDKKKANPVMSNIEVTSTAGIIHVTGDITNAGLSTANAVSVTALAPAVPEDPYKTYVIGTLKPDDFGSFEVTFSANSSTTVPLRISYKDTDGNIVTSSANVTVPVVSAVSAKPGFPLLPVAAAIVALVLFVGGWAVYLRRQGQ